MTYFVYASSTSSPRRRANSRFLPPPRIVPTTIICIVLYALVCLGASVSSALLPASPGLRSSGPIFAVRAAFLPGSPSPFFLGLRAVSRSLRLARLSHLLFWRDSIVPPRRRRFATSSPLLTSLPPASASSGLATGPMPRSTSSFELACMVVAALGSPVAALLLGM